MWSGEVYFKHEKKSQSWGRGGELGVNLEGTRKKE